MFQCVAHRYVIGKKNLSSPDNGVKHAGTCSRNMV